MEKANFKKILPGIISVAIIIGMAIQSFATNVDMAAFVKKDKYMTKYYELDYRINDIEKELERLYKFTCTNVRSYGGSRGNYFQYNVGKVLFDSNGISTAYKVQIDPIADLSEEKYLKVNYRSGLYTPSASTMGRTANTQKWSTEISASAVRWNPSIEPAPNCKIRYEMSRTMSGTSSWDLSESSINITIVMGPFKKFINTTKTGSTILSGGYIGELDNRQFSPAGFIPSAGSTSYAYGTETEPTSWTTDSTGRIYYFSNVNSTPANYTNQNTQYTREEMADRLKNDPYSKNANFYKSKMNINDAFARDLSQYKNVWIKSSYSYNGNFSPVSNAGISEATLTTWNNNK